MLNPKSLLKILPAMLLSFVQVVVASEAARSQLAPPPAGRPLPPIVPESLDRQFLQHLLPCNLFGPELSKIRLSGLRLPGSTEPTQPSLNDAIKTLLSAKKALEPAKKVQQSSTYGMPAPLPKLNGSEYYDAVDTVVGFGEAAVPTMVELLQDDDLEMRSAAEDVLMARYSPSQLTRDRLILLLSHADIDVRFRAASILGQIATISDLIPLLRARNPNIRIRATQALAELIAGFRVQWEPEFESILPELQSLLQDENLFVRGYAAWAIGKMNDRGKPAIPDLQRLLNDPDADVQAIARQAIDQIQSPLLATTSPSPTPIVSLPEIQPPPLPLPVDFDQLIQNLRNPSDYSAEGAIEAQIPQVGLKALPKLIPLLQDPDQFVRSKGTRIIGRSIGAPAIPALLPLLQDANPAVQISALETLKSMGKPGVKQLILLLQNPTLRQRVIPALDSNPELSDLTIPALSPLLNDQDFRIRATSAATIGSLYRYDTTKLTTKPPIAQLTPLLRDSQLLVRWRTIKAFGEMGAVAEAALPSLIPLLDDPSPLLQSETSQTIARIGPAALPLLANRLKSSDAKVRSRAVNAINTWETWPAPIAQTVVPSLLALLDDPDLELRKDVIYALGGAKTAANQIVPKLTPRLRDPELQYAVLHTLGKMGKSSASAVPELITLLQQSPSDNIAEALGLIGPAAQSAIPELNRLMQRSSTSEQTQKSAQWAIDQIRQVPGRKTERPSWRSLSKAPAISFTGQEVDILSLLSLLQDHDSSVQSTVMSRLSSEFRWKNSQPALPKLLSLMKSPDPTLRLNAVRLLGTIGEPAQVAIPDLFELLKNQELSSSDRATIISAIGTIDQSNRSTIPNLIPLLKDPDASVRSATAEALGKMGISAKATIPHLIPLLNDSDPQVRLNSAIALGKMGETAKFAVPNLIQLLKHPDAGIRTDAASALGNIGESAKVAIPDLLPLLKDSEYNVRSIVIKSIANMGEPANAAVPHLIPLLKDSDYFIRSSAVEALGQIGKSAKSAIPSMLPLLKDSEQYVRKSAVRAFANMGEAAKSTIPSIVPLLKDSDWFIRSSAACALGNMGESAKSTIPSLLPLLKDSDWFVRSSASNALEKLGHKF